MVSMAYLDRVNLVNNSDLVVVHDGLDDFAVDHLLKYFGLVMVANFNGVVCSGL